ncbi:MAG: hypothetical protein ACRDUX_30795, partial [Mycobacterium sp.]
YTAISATFYPTEIRSTGTSWTSGISRFGAVLGAAVGTTLASMGVTFQQVFLLLVIPVSIGAICMTLKGLYYRNSPVATDLDGLVSSPESPRNVPTHLGN